MMNNLESKIQDILSAKTIDTFQSTHLDAKGVYEVVFICSGGGEYEGTTIKLRCENTVALSGSLFAHRFDNIRIKISDDIPQDWSIDLDEGYTFLDINTDHGQRLLVACFDVTIIP